MANGPGPVWDGKIHKRAKFGDPFDWDTAKGAQRRQQTARRRRKWAEQDRRWREQQEAERPPQLRWPFRIISDLIFRD
jgi:hypothetical protein